MIESYPNQFVSVPLDSIDSEDTLTDFSLSAAPAALEQSIRSSGVVHPVVLMASDGRHRIVCGHRRVRIAQALGRDSIAARLIETPLKDSERLLLNLSENRGHRVFSDVEKGLLLAKLLQADLTEAAIIDEYMPWIGLERSKKWLQRLVRVRELTPALQRLLHELNVPVRVFDPLLRWSEADRLATFPVFAALRPGVNKWRDLLELVDEIAVKSNRSPAAVLNETEVRSILDGDTAAPEKYALLTQALSAKRYPHWTALRKQAAQAMDRLQLEPETKIRVQDSFESNEMRIELKFYDSKSLVRQVEALDRAARSEAMATLIGMFRNLDG